MILQRKQKQVVFEAIERRMQMAQVSGGKKLVNGSEAVVAPVPAKLFLVEPKRVRTVSASGFVSWVEYLPEEEEKEQLWPEGLQMGAQQAKGRVLEMPSNRPAPRGMFAGLRALVDPKPLMGHPMLSWLRVI